MNTRQFKTATTFSIDQLHLALTCGVWYSFGKDKNDLPKYYKSANPLFAKTKQGDFAFLVVNPTNPTLFLKLTQNTFNKKWGIVGTPTPAERLLKAIFPDEQIGKVDSKEVI